MWSLWRRLIGLLGVLARLQLGRSEVGAHDRLGAHHAEREHECALILIEGARTRPRQPEHSTQLAIRPDGNDRRRAGTGADHGEAPVLVLPQRRLGCEEQRFADARNVGERYRGVEGKLVERCLHLGGEPDRVENGEFLLDGAGAVPTGVWGAGGEWAERYDDGARCAKRRQGLLLDQVRGILGTERVGE